MGFYFVYKIQHQMCLSNVSFWKVNKHKGDQCDKNVQQMSGKSNCCHNYIDLIEKLGQFIIMSI